MLDASTVDVYRGSHVVLFLYNVADRRTSLISVSFVSHLCLICVSFVSHLFFCTNRFVYNVSILRLSSGDDEVPEPEVCVL